MVKQTRIGIFLFAVLVLVATACTGGEPADTDLVASEPTGETDAEDNDPGDQAQSGSESGSLVRLQLDSQ